MHSKPTPKGRPFIMCEVALHLSEYGVYQALGHFAVEFTANTYELRPLFLLA